MSAAEATAYLQGFNEQALAQGRTTWAVAVPVSVVYDGEPAVGEAIK